MSKQSTSHLFMIEPESFYSNEQTSYTNHYQEEASDEDIGEITRKALVEFHNLKDKIEANARDLNFIPKQAKLPI